MKSTIRLFNALPIKEKKKKKATKELLESTIRRGFVFSPEVIHNYSNCHELIKLVEQEVGLTPEKMNATFHKSWEKVSTASIEQLVMEQIVHYFTTYGFKEMGIYDEDSIYIPTEKLEIPDLEEDNIKLTIIRGYTKKELKAKLTDILKTGIALKEDTIEDVLDVALFVGLDASDVEQIQNREVKIALYTHLDIVPSDPTEFLRLIVYRETNRTLLIKDAKTIDELKASKNLGMNALFSKFISNNGIEKLAGIFYRFKPLFLAMRTNSHLKKTINRIRRLAKRYHIPMKANYLNTITEQLKNGTLDLKRLETELEKVVIFRKIKLAYALKFRLEDRNHIIYRIRNGKGYATEIDWKTTEHTREAFDTVLKSVIKDIKKNVSGKKIYIPENINYTLPSTEKQFTGNFPSGTYVTTSRDMIFGIHWKDVVSSTIDLDMSLLNCTQKFGWDGDYRNAERSILFSGDITAAPRGATELFYVKKQEMSASIMMMNYYNFNKDIVVPYKIFVAQEPVQHMRHNYLVNPNNMLASTQSKIKQKEKIIGLLVTSYTDCRFYFTETELGKSITSSNNKSTESARRYLFDFFTNQIDLKDVLISAGAKLVSDKKKCDIDLSPEELQRDTIIKIIKRS